MSTCCCHHGSYCHSNDNANNSGVLGIRVVYILPKDTQLAEDITKGLFRSCNCPLINGNNNVITQQTQPDVGVTNTTLQTENNFGKANSAPALTSTTNETVVRDESKQDQTEETINRSETVTDQTETVVTRTEAYKTQVLTITSQDVQKTTKTENQQQLFTQVDLKVQGRPDILVVRFDDKQTETPVTVIKGPSPISSKQTDPVKTEDRNISQHQQIKCIKCPCLIDIQAQPKKIKECTHSELSCCDICCSGKIDGTGFCCDECTKFGREYERRIQDPDKVKKRKQKKEKKEGGFFKCFTKCCKSSNDKKRKKEKKEKKPKTIQIHENDKNYKEEIIAKRCRCTDSHEYGRYRENDSVGSNSTSQTDECKGNRCSLDGRRTNSKRY